jgi:hypothetical protein
MNCQALKIGFPLNKFSIKNSQSENYKILRKNSLKKHYRAAEETNTSLHDKE